jgi:hypothetical protein
VENLLAADAGSPTAAAPAAAMKARLPSQRSRGVTSEGFGSVSCGLRRGGKIAERMGVLLACPARMLMMRAGPHFCKVAT